MGERDGLPTWASATLRYTVAVLLLGAVIYLAGGVEIPEIVRPGWLVAAGVGYVAFTTGMALAWWVYMGRPRGGGWARTFWADQASHVTSLVLPSPAPSLTRPLFLRGRIDATLALASTIVDRLNVVVVYGLGVLLTVPFVVQAGARVELVAIVLGAGLGLVLLSAIFQWLLHRRPSPESWSGWEAWVLPFGGMAQTGARVVAEATEDARAIARNLERMVGGIGLQIVAIVLCQGAASVLLARGMNLEADLWAAFLFPTAANAMAILPILPRGLGAVEGAGTALFATIGVASADALAFMIAHRALFTVGILLLGAWPFVTSSANLLSDAIEASREGLA